jgi:hypothetical protein
LYVQSRFTALILSALHPLQGSPPLALPHQKFKITSHIRQTVPSRALVGSQYYGHCRILPRVFEFCLFVRPCRLTPQEDRWWHFTYRASKWTKCFGRTGRMGAVFLVDYCKSSPTCWHFKCTRKGHWPWQLFSKGPQPSPKFPPVTLYPTYNCVIHSKDIISQPPFPTSPTKYRRCKFLDSSTVA